MREVAGALGVEDRLFLKRIDPDKSAIREMFVARNQVIHELDLRDPDTTSRGAPAHKRIARTNNDVETRSSEILSVVQYIINHVAGLLAAR